MTIIDTYQFISDITIIKQILKIKYNILLLHPNEYLAPILHIRG